ncbi:MAG: aminotransferase class I/II-fold pyridoxal phosphate-dependent enzyme, partial [Mycobacteriales bacterium]
MSSETARLTREHLESLPTYRPGRRPEQISQELGISEAVKLSANELPFGPLPGVVEAVTRAATQVHRYPDMFVGELREELAKRHGVDVEELVTGCGSVALCEHLTVATAAPRDEVIFGWRSFEAYPILVARIDAAPVRVPNTPDHRIDIDGILDSVTAATRLIFLCSPNNPTGSLIGREELQRLLAGVPDNVVVALDEAYRDFVTDPHAPDSLSLRVDHPNLVVLRSFS